VDTFFSTDITDPPEASGRGLLELRDCEELRQRPAPVAKRIGDSTVRILAKLLDVTNPGLWMAHCHMAEHMHSGMMVSFPVDRAVTP
jgi:Multicopper oxidase